MKQYDSDGADAAQAMDLWRREDAAREARQISGDDVLTLRRALAAASDVLRQINTRGLPFAQRRDIFRATTAIDAAALVVAAKTGAE